MLSLMEAVSGALGSSMALETLVPFEQTSNENVKPIRCDAAQIFEIVFLEVTYIKILGLSRFFVRLQA